MPSDTTKPIAVCFVAPKTYPLLNRSIEGVFGGAEVDLVLLGTALAEDGGFCVSFVSGDYGQPAREQRGAVTVFRSVRPGQSGLAGALRLWRAMKRAQADVYMLEAASPGVPLAAWFCRRHRRALVYRTAHRDECDGTYRRAHPMWGRAFAWALRRAAVVLAQNEDDARLLRQTVGTAAQVIRNAHPLGPLEPQASRDIILWAGRSAGFKRPRRFLDLARRFPDERFVMICQRATGDERYETLQDEAEAVGNVQFIPRVPFHEMEAYFRRARVFVNTSDAEGFPNTFVQTAAAGAPILSYAVNPDGFLTAFSCGIDCGGHFDRMVQGLRFLLDQDRYVEIGLNARRYAEEHHDMAKVVEQYKALFRGLVGGDLG